MARVGLELQKEFKESSIVSTLKGSAYSTSVVLGPMLVVILGYVAINILLDQSRIPYDERDLLTSIALYVFIFSLILTGPLSTVISRYIADSIFEERIEDVVPCYYTGLLVNLIVASAACIPFGIVTVVVGGADPLVIFVGVWMFYALFFVYYTMTYISALKEYKSISYAFLVGILLGVALTYISFSVLQWSFVLSVSTSYSVGFTYIAIRLYSLFTRFFTQNSRKYSLLLSYIRKHYILFFVNLFYIVGLFVHNFIFWHHSDYIIILAATLRSAPIYDVATFLAMLTNCTIMVLFTVRVESNFHSKYQIYCQELIGGTGQDIQKAKENMFMTLSKEIFYIIQIQAIISLILFLVIVTLGPRFSFGGLVQYIYPALAAGYFILFVMYCMIIFLYYFQDYTGAMITAFTFLFFTAIFAYISTQMPVFLHGMGPIGGAFAAWSVGFARLRYIEKNIDTHIFCQGTLLRKIIMSKGMIYKINEKAFITIAKKIKKYKFLNEHGISTPLRDGK